MLNLGHPLQACDNGGRRQPVGGPRRPRRSDHRWIGHPNGGCTDVPVDGVANQRAALIHEVAPDTDGRPWARRFVRSGQAASET
jgi:hypothetical protein